MLSGLWRARKGINCMIAFLMFLFQFLGGVSAFSQLAKVQVVNLSSAVNGADIYSNGNLMIDNLVANAATGYVEFIATSSSGIVVAPSSSNSAADGILSITANLKADSNYILVIYDKSNAVPSSPAMLLINNTKRQSDLPDATEVVFNHLIENAPALNIVLRGGNMIVGNLGFQQHSLATKLPAADNFLDIKAAGTTDILGTYRLSLQGIEGKVSQVFISGSTQNATTLKLYSVTEGGLLVTVDFAPVGRVQLMSTFNDTIDVFKNGTRFSEDLAPGGAMPYKYIPGGIPMNIGMAPSNSLSLGDPLPIYSNTTFTFENMGTYLAVAAGSMGNAAFPPTLFFSGANRERAVDTSDVDIKFFNGVTSTNTITLSDDWGEWFPDISYGGFSDYMTKSPSEYNIYIKNNLTGVLMGAYPVNFSAFKGQSLVLYTLQNKVGNIELWMAKQNGHTQQLSVTVSTTFSDTPFQNVSLSPNPVKEELAISGFIPVSKEQQLTCAVFNTQGALMIQKNIIVSNNTAFYTSVEVSQWPVGLYVVQLVSEQGQSHIVKFQITK